MAEQLALRFGDLLRQLRAEAGLTQRNWPRRRAFLRGR
jgi:hypothetical protein